MAHVHCGNTISEFESGSADQKIGQSYADTSGSALTIYLSGAKGHRYSDRQHGNRRDELMKKLPARLLSLLGICPRNSMRQLYDRYD